MDEHATQVFERPPSRLRDRRLLLVAAEACVFWSVMATNFPPRSLYEPVLAETFGNLVVQLTFMWLMLVLVLSPYAWERWHRLRYGRCEIDRDHARFEFVTSNWHESKAKVPLVELRDFVQTPHGLLVRDARASAWSRFRRPLLVPVDSEAERAAVVQLLEARQLEALRSSPPAA